VNNLLLPVALVALIAGVGVFFAFGNAGGDATTQDRLIARLDAIDGKLSSLEDDLAARDATIESLRSAVSANRGAGMQRQPETGNLAGMVDAAVERALAERMAAGSDALADALAGDPEADAARAAIVPNAVRRMLDPLLSDAEREELWAEIRDAGLVEEAIAALEAESEGNPENTDLLVELGYAYLQPIFTGDAAGPDAGMWSMKSDGAYDRALAIDPQNWDARFSKAVSYSFWPPVFGKQAEAIGHFETLIEQQGSRPKEDRFVQTYQFLGNLYAQTGKQAEAEAAWRAGLEQFPDNSGLKQSLGID
jgi:tetratricopeptide (TPR) repeat protein